MSGVTVSLPDLMETIEQIYDGWHELVFAGAGNCWIQDGDAELIAEFNDHDALYTWHFKQQEILDEQRKEAYKQQGYIEY